MIRIARYVLSLVLALLFLGCAATRDYSKMSEGERLFRRNCRSCHLLPRPVAYSDAAWDTLVPRYAVRARLSESEIAKILKHVKSVN